MIHHQRIYLNLCCSFYTANHDVHLFDDYGPNVQQVLIHTAHMFGFQALLEQFYVILRTAFDIVCTVFEHHYHCIYFSKSVQQVNVAYINNTN